MRRACTFGLLSRVLVAGRVPAFFVLRRHFCIKATKKRLPKEPLNLRGAAYRIRTYDALIRSQVLYPAEVTPRAIIYNASHPGGRQVRIANL